MAQLLSVTVVSMTTGPFAGTAAINIGQIQTAQAAVTPSTNTVIQFENYDLPTLPERITVSDTYATIAAAIGSYGTGKSYSASVIEYNGVSAVSTRNLSVDDMMMAFAVGSQTLLLTRGDHQTDKYLLGITLANFVIAVNAL